MSSSDLEQILKFYNSINDWTRKNQYLYENSKPTIEKADLIYNKLQEAYKKNFKEDWTETQLFNGEVKKCDECHSLIKTYSKLISQLQEDFHINKYELRNLCDIFENFIDEYESSLKILQYSEPKIKNSYLFQYVVNNKPNIEPIYHLKKMCNILETAPYKTYIPRIPRTLQNILKNQTISYIRHKDSFDDLLNLKMKNGNPKCSGTIQYRLMNQDRLENMLCLQNYIQDLISSQTITHFNSEWKIPFLDYSIHSLLSNSKRISDETAGGIVYSSIFNKKLPIILKCGKQDDFDTNNILHEFIVGSFLNRLRVNTPSFCYTYFGFLCTGFELGFDQMCKIIPINPFNLNIEKDEENDFVTTTIIGMENCNGVALRNFCEEYNNDILTLAEVFIQLLVALNLAYDKYKFIHGDFHSKNVIVIELDEMKLISFGNYRLKTKFLPQIIDFGRSIIDVGFGVLTPFSQMFTNFINPSTIEYQVCKEGKNSFRSFDILRCLTSLKLKSYDFIKECFKPFYKIQSNCKVRRWLEKFETIKQITFEDHHYIDIDLQLLIDSCHDVIEKNSGQINKI